jgi:hypothetical protein
MLKNVAKIPDFENSFGLIQNRLHIFRDVCIMGAGQKF